MLRGKSCIEETHYEILSAREDSTNEEIRACYRAAILNSHPDKLKKESMETPQSNNGSDTTFLKVQNAWEVLGNSSSRALYDNELRASRRDDVVAGNDVSLEEMMVEDGGEEVEFYYQCRCGDYFSVDSVELGEMGYRFLRVGNKMSLQTGEALPASVVLPCGSCSLKIRLLIDSDICVPVDVETIL